MIIQGSRDNTITAQFDENYGSLKSKLKKKDVWTLQASIIFIYQLFLTLNYLQHHRILHMDLKDDNILVAPGISLIGIKGQYSPIIIDFGISYIGEKDDTNPHNPICFKPIHDVYTFLYSVKKHTPRHQVHFLKVIDEIVAHIFGTEFKSLEKITEKVYLSLSSKGCQHIGRNKFLFSDILKTPIFQYFFFKNSQIP